MNKLLKNKCINILLVLLPLVASIICIVIMYVRNNAASFGVLKPIEIVGEYSYDGENWQELTADSELSAFDGELIVRAKIKNNISAGLKFLFFCNHIGTSFYINDELCYMDAQMQVGIIGIGLMDSMCGREWRFFTTKGVTADDVIEIHLINYQAGNKNAYREMLDNIYIVPEVGEILQKSMSQYKDFRIVGGGIIVVAVMLLGAAVAFAFTHSSVGNKLMGYGLVVLFAGGFFIFDSVTIGNQLRLALSNYGAQLCMMLFVYFVGVLIKSNLSGTQSKIARIVVIVEGIIDSILIVVAIVGKILIFDEFISSFTFSSSISNKLITVFEFGLSTTFIPPKLSATIEYSPSASNAKLSIPINMYDLDINVFIVTDLPAPDLANITIL